MKKVFTAVVMVAMLAACASASKSASDLDISMIRYEKAWRWNDIEVLRYHHKEGTYQSSQLEAYKNIRVGKYEVIDSTSLEGKKVLHKVAISFFFQDDYRVKDIVMDQVWEFDKQLNRWVITSPLPVLR